LGRLVRLNGWLRIGIVLSALWMVGSSAYRFSQEMEVQRGYSNFMYNDRANCLGQNSLRRYNNQPEQVCTTKAAVDATYKQDVPWSMILIPPTFWLILAWLGIGIAYGAFRWIMRGFKPRARK